MIDDFKIAFILSAGRTGTVKISKDIQKNFPQVTCVHEPEISRFEMMFANFKNIHGIGASLLNRALRFRLETACRTIKPQSMYLEINPFLCAYADLLPIIVPSLKVVHLVREPISWTNSITQFKASKKFRNFIDKVPYATP